MQRNAVEVPNRLFQEVPAVIPPDPKLTEGRRIAFNPNEAFDADTSLSA